MLAQELMVTTVMVISQPDESDTEADDQGYQ